MNYSIESLYEVIEVELHKYLDDALLDKRYEIVLCLAMDSMPYDDDIKPINELGEFIMDVVAVIMKLEIQSDNFVEQVCLAQDLAVMFILRNVRPRDIDFISKVRKLRQEKGL